MKFFFSFFLKFLFFFWAIFRGPHLFPPGGRPGVTLKRVLSRTDSFVCLFHYYYFVRAILRFFHVVATDDVGRAGQWPQTRWNAALINFSFFVSPKKARLKERKKEKESDLGKKWCERFIFFSFFFCVQRRIHWEDEKRAKFNASTAVALLDVVKKKDKQKKRDNQEKRFHFCALFFLAVLLLAFWRREDAHAPKEIKRKKKTKQNKTKRNKIIKKKWTKISGQ